MIYKIVNTEEISTDSLSDTKEEEYRIFSFVLTALKIRTLIKNE